MSLEIVAQTPAIAPLVSAVIPVYNAAEYLAAAVESVLAQTYSNVECIVVDDGSTDGTPDVIRSFGARVIAVQQPNGGVASARNAGVGAARGEFVAFLDADDLWKPEKLERQLSLFQRRPELGLVYAAITIVDQELRPIDQMAAPCGSMALRNSLLMEQPVMAITMTGVVPKHVFFDVGGFDTRLSTAADTDFACRVACRYPVAGVADALALYRQHSAQMHLNPRTLEHDMLLVFEKLFGDEILPLPVRRLRRRAFSNLHTILAMAYGHKGELGRSVGHVVTALRKHPAPFFTRTSRWARARIRRKILGAPTVG